MNVILQKDFKEPSDIQMVINLKDVTTRRFVTQTNLLETIFIFASVSFNKLSMLI